MTTIKSIRNLLLLFAAAAVVAPAGLRAQADTAWSHWYLRDLDSLRAAISANHPGAIDSMNPAFARTLDRAYAEARSLAPRITSFSAFRLGLARFIDEFEDEHLQIGFSRQVDSLREAGIITAYRNGRFYVVDVHNRYDNRADLLDAQLSSCDGASAADEFRNRVLWWRGRASIEADWYRQAPLFFVDYGSPAPAPPRNCTFEKNGKAFSLALQWRMTERNALNAVLQRSNPVQPRSISSARVGNRGLWMNLPTFAANADPELGAMRSTLDSLRAFTKAVPDWDLIVFDLRNNNGGSSTWGDEIAKIVFGDEWARQATSYLFDGVYTEWRLSEDNIKSMRGIAEQIARRDGAQSASAVSFRTFVDSAEAEWKRGAKYYGTRQTRTGARPPRPAAVPGSIVVITTPACFSACLDFLDRMRLHPAVRQVGQTTGVDTNYMENWGGPISEFTRWGHPLKVYRNRRRAMNEAYRPHVPYEGRLDDNAALTNWVMNNYRNW